MFVRELYILSNNVSAVSLTFDTNRRHQLNHLLTTFLLLPPRTMTSHYVTKRYTSLKADVSVSLEGSGTESGSTTGRGTGGLGGEGGPQAIADMFTSGQINSGGIVDAGSSSSSAEEGVAFFGQGQAQETAFLWGCASEQQERDQLLSFVCLGCFDPAARLQVCYTACDCVCFNSGRLVASQCSHRTLVDARPPLF